MSKVLFKVQYFHPSSLPPLCEFMSFIKYESHINSEIKLGIIIL